MASTMDAMFGRGLAAGQDGAQASLVSAPEAERMVEALREFGVEDVGNAAWMQQHQHVEKLNLQAHFNAQAHSDEFVVEAFCSFDKINVLVKDLLVTEVWKEKVMPHLRKHLAEKVDSVTSYTLLYHEAAAANLLEVLLFHSHAVSALDEDHLVELVDWCYRKIIYLNNQGQQDKEYVARTAQELLAMTPLDELESRDREIRHGTAICALTILRYLTDRPPDLPVGIVARMLSTNDVLMALLPLLDSPPWERRATRPPPPAPQPANAGAAGKPARPRTVTERYNGNAWVEVEPRDRLRVSQCDAQVWLALNNLVVDPRFRSRYEWDDFRRERLQKVRRYLNEVMFDQLPVLKDLQRVLEEVAMGVSQGGGAAAVAGQGGSTGARGLILEQVPAIREALLAGTDWAEVARRVRRGHLKGGAAAGAGAYSKEHVEEMMRALQFMVDMDPKGGEGTGASGAADEERTVFFESKWRPPEGGEWRMHDHFKCEIDGEKKPEDVELEGVGGHRVRGRRYALRRFTADCLAMPASGKVLATLRGRRCEALLDLPAPHTKEAANEAAKVLWLTVGILAQDGFVLQLKLRKGAAATEKDRHAGVYHIYYPVGGAVTISQEMEEGGAK
ncbi:unnamed protein product [Pedinophyceae sp. YPF-701]|nr:unnamed protein product [Pedinophyceae sp. YPF-701]